MDFIFSKKRTKALSDDDGKEQKLMPIEKISQDVQPMDHSKQLAQKSGFVSLRDRMNDLAEQSSRNHGDHRRTKRQASVPVEERDDDCHQHKRPKIPIMRLSKEDWNVKCWEERLSSHKRLHQAAHNRQIATGDTSNFEGPNRPTKPEQQVEVFQGRIEDVATKLEKVREGLPLDEKLYELTLNKGRHKTKSSHEWTDLLKQELEKGVHHPTVLKSTFTTIGSGSENGSLHTRPPSKSPLGRPIRSIFQDDDDDDGNNDNENGDPTSRPS